VRKWGWAAAAGLAACAAFPPKVELQSRARGFRAQSAAVAALTGAPEKDPAVSRALARAARSAGLRAVSLEEADGVLAGTEISLDSLSDPRTLAQLRKATGADIAVFLGVDPAGVSAQLTVIDTLSGDAVLRAIIRPRGKTMTPEEAAQAASGPLSTLSGRGVAARFDEIPVP
jgi:hypothetical protein